MSAHLQVIQRTHSRHSGVDLLPSRWIPLSLLLRRPEGWELPKQRQNDPNTPVSAIKEMCEYRTVACARLRKRP